MGPFEIRNKVCTYSQKTQFRSKTTKHKKNMTYYHLLFELQSAPLASSPRVAVYKHVHVYAYIYIYIYMNIFVRLSCSRRMRHLSRAAGLRPAACDLAPLCEAYCAASLGRNAMMLPKRIRRSKYWKTPNQRRRQATGR